MNNKDFRPDCPICGELWIHCKCYDPKESIIKRKIRRKKFVQEENKYETSKRKKNSG